MLEYQPNREYYFQVINGIFQVVSDASVFYEQCRVNPTDSVLEVVLKYYLYVHSQTDCFVPLQIYLRIISVLPLIPDQRGNIYMCESCHYYVVFPKPRKTHYIYNLLDGFFLSSNWGAYLTHYVQNYGKEKVIGEHSLDYIPVQQEMFRKYHQVEATKICHESAVNVKPFISFDLHYTHILNKLHRLELTLNLKSCGDTTKQTTNYLWYIFRRININNFQPSKFDIETVLTHAKKYMTMTSKTNYNTVLAGFAFLVLNQLLNQRVLYDYLAIKLQKPMRYPYASERVVANIFGVHITSLQHVINEIAKKITKNTHFFD